MKKSTENHVKVTSCVTEAITAMASKKIGYHVSKMLDGNCVVNDHTDKATSIDGIAMLDSGDTVALFKGSIFTMNRLYVSKADNSLHMSTWSVASTLNTRGKSLTDTIQDYNDRLLEVYMDTDLPVSGFIVAYRLFD